MSINPRNTAIKRILADVRELNKHKTCRYHAVPLEDNLFEWHFTIRGPVGTDFEGGLYHGRILLAADYPFKPPNIVFTTKNGRFEVGTKICLSISAHHPEHWQPAWGVRTMLEAIISFLPSEGAGAIGALDWTPVERKKLAEESNAYICPICGPIKDTLPDVTDETDVMDADIAAQITQLHVHGLGAASPAPSEKTGKEPSASAVHVALTPPIISSQLVTRDTINEEIQRDIDRNDVQEILPHQLQSPVQTSTPDSPIRNYTNQELQSPNTGVTSTSNIPVTPTNLSHPPATETPLSIRAVRRRVFANRQITENIPDEEEDGNRIPQQAQTDWIDILTSSLLVVIGLIVLILLYRILNRQYQNYILNIPYSK